MKMDSRRFESIYNRENYLTYEELMREDVMDEEYFKQTGKHGFYMNGEKTAAFSKWLLGGKFNHQLLVFRSVW